MAKGGRYRQGVGAPRPAPPPRSLPPGWVPPPRPQPVPEHPGGHPGEHPGAPPPAAAPPLPPDWPPPAPWAPPARAALRADPAPGWAYAPPEAGAPVFRAEPDRPGRSAFWRAVQVTLAVTAAGVLGVGVVVGVLVGFIWSMSENHHEMFEAPYVLEDKAVVAAARAGCARLEESLAGIPEPRPGASVAVRRAAMDAENAAVERLVARVNAVGATRLADDPPAVEWLRDWDRLVRARERYALDLAAGRPPLLDLDDGYGGTIVRRMNRALPDGCDVPVRLYDLPGAVPGGQPLAETTR